jgi:photosystem II PsbZ protein
MQILNTLTVLALVVMSFALIVAVPVLYASSEDSGRSNRLILLGGIAWVALVLVNWGMSFFVVRGQRPWGLGPACGKAQSGGCPGDF